jgi:hypothetical protein
MPAGEALEDTEWLWPGTLPYNHSGSANSTIELGSEVSKDTMGDLASLRDSSEMGEGEEVEQGDAGQGVDLQSSVLGNTNAVLHHTYNAYEWAPDVELAAAALDILIKMLIPNCISKWHLNLFEGEK